MNLKKNFYKFLYVSLSVPEHIKVDNKLLFLNSHQQYYESVQYTFSKMSVINNINDYIKNIYCNMIETDKKPPQSRIIIRCSLQDNDYINNSFKRNFKSFPWRGDIIFKSIELSESPVLDFLTHDWSEKSEQSK